MKRSNRLMPVLVILASFLALGALADMPATSTDKHEPMTFQGLRMRTNIAVAIPGMYGVELVPMGPSLFQEMTPCQFISTLSADAYPEPWGGPAFEADESRYFQPTGTMKAGDWENPCSNRIPSDAMAVAYRVSVRDAAGDGKVYAAPASWTPASGLPVLQFHKGDSLVEEGAMMIRGGGFSLSTFEAGTDVVVELLGYFIEDPDGKVKPGPQGAKGDKGEAGPEGPMGPAGPAGPGIRRISGILSFPPGGMITITDSAITETSLILVNYVGAHGKETHVEEQGDGWATFSGTPHKDFRYVVLAIP